MQLMLQLQAVLNHTSCEAFFHRHIYPVFKTKQLSSAAAMAVSSTKWFYPARVPTPPKLYVYCSPQRINLIAKTTEGGKTLQTTPLEAKDNAPCVILKMQKCLHLAT